LVKKRKRSAKQKANDARLRAGLKPIKQNGRKTKSTRKGQRRKTARRAYEGLTVRVRKRGSKGRQKRTDSAWIF
jgi:hypothetical protein